MRVLYRLNAGEGWSDRRRMLVIEVGDVRRRPPFDIRADVAVYHTGYAPLITASRSEPKVQHTSQHMPSMFVSV